MLAPEAARERLATVMVEGWQERRLADVVRLQPHLRGLTLSWLDFDAAGRPFRDYQAQQEALLAAASRLDGLTAAERMSVFAALCPKLSAPVEQAWQVMQRLPYQSGGTRRAFRAPHTPATSLQARANWLRYLVGEIRGYEQDVAWFAAWAPYLHYGMVPALGTLFAAAIDGGGQEGQAVFEVLAASARGEHEVGAMGRHVARGLLVASRPEGWQLVEGMLLAAQREEGLRQVILETVDEAHPEAFRRMLRLILEHNLARFSAVVRAAGVWFGQQWEAGEARALNETLGHVLRCLESAEARAEGLASADPQLLYLALWALAYEDAPAAVAPAARLLASEQVERRFVGAHLLAQLGLPEAQRALVPALDDEDLRVAARAVQAWQWGVDRSLVEGDLFEHLERALPRFPKQATLKPIVWPWMALAVERRAVTGTLLRCLGTRPATRLIPYIHDMEPFERRRVVDLLAAAKAWDDETRTLFFSLLGDPSPDVREAALKAVAAFKVTDDEAERLEALLERKPGDLRRGVLVLLLGQPDEAALASAGRLLDARDTLMRQGGLELLRRMVELGRRADDCRGLGGRFQPASPDEARLLDFVVQKERKAATLADGLGLYDPSERTRPAPPQAPPDFKPGLLRGPKAAPVSKAAIACLQSLDALVHNQRATPFTIERGGKVEEVLLGNLRWGLPAPMSGVTTAEDAARLPLRELWEDWWAGRPAEQRDADGLELVRALAPLQAAGPAFWTEQAPGWLQGAVKGLYGGFDANTLRYAALVGSVLKWLVQLHPPAGAADCLLDAIEFGCTLVPRDELAQVPEGRRDGWRTSWPFLAWLRLAREHRRMAPEAWSSEQHVRYWRLLRWMDEPAPGAARHRPALEEVLPAYRAGEATEADLLDLILDPQRRVLWSLSARKPPAFAAGYPELAGLVERCRRRILEVELERGEMPTEASPLALQLRWTGDLDVLVRSLAALGRGRFAHSAHQDGYGKAAVLSHLVRATMPAEADTPAAFAAAVRAAGVRPARLVELAVFAPQWAAHVEHALGRPGLAEAVWWIHAHAKGSDWRVDAEIREAWAAEINEHTPLDALRLLDGAVDVAWFHRVLEQLGEERWAEVYGAAEYASGGAGHKRAQIFADAMLGGVGEAELLERITAKRHQDSLRALGLLPLDECEARVAQLLGRYKAIQEFLRGSRQFGAQRQASEKLAAEIAMENLARTAGYADPLRLQWAMEAQAAADLAAGPLLVTVEGVTVALAIDAWGEPELTVEKDGRPLKAVPPRVKKDAQVAALEARKREVKQQAARMRRSLEAAMCRGDCFSAAELRELMAHPVLAPLLEELVFIAEGATGYPAQGGRALQRHDGGLQLLAEGQMLRIAHPCDLLATGEWSEWQRECFLAERRQPFKQVYRELYVLTAAERAEGNLSRRYAGHQVQTNQALALLKGRGWVVHPEEGIRRTFHDQGITAWVTTLGSILTPAEVEGLTLEGVGFARRGGWQPLPLEQVPPRLFSEVMRDLDLVVSVAHQGGVDPEASASTVEMRAALIRETCGLLKAANVSLQGTHALIEGKLGSYSVHLGSAVVHRQPGGALCIVPVHAQHRGRLFLPFADDDPKTAEVLSKVLLLARDAEIKDPTILEQILGRPR